MAPPAEESMAFFSERDLASKMGKSTHALYVSIETISQYPFEESPQVQGVGLDPVADAEAPLAHDQAGDEQAEHGAADNDPPVVGGYRLTDHGCADDF